MEYRQAQKEALQRYQNAKNNAQGHVFEQCIKTACQVYREKGRARVEKIPEPFRVQKKSPGGIFFGRFTAPAQPDFMGTMNDGRSIAFEAKHTTTDRLRWDVLTDEQREALEDHHNMGAVTGICCCIKDRYFFVPWPVWREMKALFGHKYVTVEDLEPFRVRFTGAVMFLDYILPTPAESGE